MASGTQPPTRNNAARLVVLLLLAAILFNPPILAIIDRPTPFLGLPFSVIYLFTAWGAVIVALAWVVRGMVRDD